MLGSAPSALMQRSPWSKPKSLGPYQVGEEIGAGGMGEVYKGRDTRLGRDVALKVLPAGMTGDPDRRARFIREAQSHLPAESPQHRHRLRRWRVGRTGVHRHGVCGG